ncbi:MAG: hypothetical protein ACPIOQ_30275, partial [Promethearchaeia archaeon]
LRVGLRVAGRVRGVQAEHSKDLRCRLACSVIYNSVQGLLHGTEWQMQLVDTFVGFQQGRVLGIVACGSRKLNSLAMNDLLWGFLVIRDFGKTVAPLSVKEGGDLTWRGTYRALLHKRQLRRSAVRQLFRIPFPLNPLAPWTPQGGGGGRQRQGEAASGWRAGGSVRYDEPRRMPNQDRAYLRRPLGASCCHVTARTAACPTHPRVLGRARVPSCARLASCCWRRRLARCAHGACLCVRVHLCVRTWV